MLTYNVTLRKISSTHSNLRTDTVEGETAMLPVAGYRFTIVGPPLDGDASSMRVVETSRVAAVEYLGADTFRFTTRNSVYELDIHATARKPITA